MARYLIVYGTTEGQTAKIARAIRDELGRLGHDAQAFEARDLDDSFRVDGFDGVLVGASVHASGYQRSLEHFVRSHAQALNSVPSAFFSVCLGVLQKDDPKAQAEERAIIERFLAKTGWKPRLTEVLPGALMYSKYNWLMKRVMRRIARKAGGATDMTRDHEYTDWEQVRKFAGRVAL